MATDDASADPARPPAGRPRALFVLGAPRTGTTLVGSYLASSPLALDLGEYGAFHFVHTIARQTIGAMPGPFREPYLAEVRDHARRTAEGFAAEQGCQWYVDSTPFNLAAADQLSVELPDALFVLMLRHYAGTIQSLRRSFAKGYVWAGRGWAESAQVWAESYASVARLPVERTIAVSYDALCAEPARVLDQLRSVVSAYGFETTDLDPGQLATSHAPGVADRPTLGVVDPESGQVLLRPIASFAAERWSGDIQQMVWPVVEPVHRQLQATFPGVYCYPPPPPVVSVHHDIDGLQSGRLGDNW